DTPSPFGPLQSVPTSAASLLLGAMRSSTLQNYHLEGWFRCLRVTRIESTAACLAQMAGKSSPLVVMARLVSGMQNPVVSISVSIILLPGRLILRRGRL